MVPPLTWHILAISRYGVLQSLISIPSISKSNLSKLLKTCEFKCLPLPL
ncbi:Hypothetical protein SFBmNL_01275 [Candidatus Arthromitus sp. SFB-mouse-NL]|nr:Hypothetical protein SFBmNL_01275 [Candidatus Arthromitus sp. SFB-mouse-NL]